MIYDFQPLKSHFVYVDSSEQQDNFNERKQRQNQKSLSDLSYHHSSSSDQDQFYCQKCQNKVSKGDCRHQKSRRLCELNPDKFLLNDDYINRIEKIIKQNQQKLAKKTPLLIPDTDKEIIQNLQKRQKNYGFFLKALQTDKQYNKILQNKVEKLKKQNQRKKKVLQKKKISQIAQQDEEQMKKFVLDKKTKEQIIVDKIQKHAYRLGIERIRAQQKTIKSQVKQIEQNNMLKTINLETKQRNQIQQLRDQLQRMRQINKVNKADQKKALKDMQKNVVSTKKSLITKAQISQQKKFII